MSLSKNTKYILECAMANAKAAKELVDAIEAGENSVAMAAAAAAQADATQALADALAAQGDATQALADANLIATNTLYVDGNRVDAYIENGSIAKPFKTIGAAISGKPVGTLVQITSKSGGYVEDLVVPSGVSLHGMGGGNNTLITGNIVLEAGVSSTLKNLQFSGSGKKLTVNNVAVITECYSYIPVEVVGAGSISAYNFHIVPASGIVAILFNSTGFFNLTMSSVISSGAVNTIIQNSGLIQFNNVKIAGNNAGQEVIKSNGGSLVLLSCQALNMAGGIAVDMNNGATTTPNLVNGLFAVGNVICGAAVSIVEVIHFAMGALSGSQLISHGMVYNPADPSDWSGTAPKTLKEAVDRIAAALGPIA